MIMQKRDGGELKQCAIAQGMESLRQDGWRRVGQGKTTIEEVVRVTQTDEVMAETELQSAPAMIGEGAVGRWEREDGLGGEKLLVIPSAADREGSHSRNFRDREKSKRLPQSMPNL